jgi:hypothetical protein
MKLQDCSPVIMADAPDSRKTTFAYPCATNILPQGTVVSAVGPTHLPDCSIWRIPRYPFDTIHVDAIGSDLIGCELRRIILGQGYKRCLGTGMP